jgi:DNA-binding transcriptional LysR family regulator
MVPDSRQLRYFVAVAEELQFSRAARRLGISQSTLSESIRRLEAQLGVELLQRSTRMVTLTEPGGRLLTSARTALAALEEALIAIEPPKAAAILRLGLSPETRPALAEALLDAYARAGPGGPVSVRDQASGGLLSDLERHRLDVCVTCCATDLRAQRSERFSDEPAIVALAEDDPRAGASRIELRELADLPLVVTVGSESAGLGAVALTACRAAGFEPRIAPVAYAGVAPVFLRAGGFSLVPAGAALRRPPGIGFASLAQPITMPFDLAWRDEPEAPALAAFLDRARAVARSASWRTTPDRAIRRPRRRRGPRRP